MSALPHNRTLLSAPQAMEHWCKKWCLFCCCNDLCGTSTKSTKWWTYYQCEDGATKMFHFLKNQQYLELFVIAIKVRPHLCNPLFHLRFASDKEAHCALGVSFDRNTVCPSLYPEEGSWSSLAWFEAKHSRMSTLSSAILSRKLEIQY